MSRRTAIPARGASLIEVMIALGVLSVGLLAMWSLHMVGLTSNASGRRHTVATAIARELASGLERLPFADPLLTETCTAQAIVAGETVPSGGVFGGLVTAAGTITPGAHEWDDATRRVPGVRLTSELRENAEGQGYERRWSVWRLLSPRAPAGAPAGVKVIAVSVVWRDPPFTRPREVVLYTEVTDAMALATGMASSP